MPQVTRTVSRRGVVYVDTLHPQVGPLQRGRIQATQPVTPDPQARCTWTVIDADHIEVGVVTGDYLDAEAQLLAATTWADELDPNYEEDLS